MTGDTDSQGHNSSRTLDVVPSWRKRAKIHHATDNNDNDNVHVLEAFEDPGQLDEEIALLRLLGRGAPLLVDAAEMRQDGEGEVEGETAEENAEEGHPFEVFEEGAEEGLLAEAVAQDGEGDGAEDVEDYD